jgi:hypothetical protein
LEPPQQQRIYVPLPLSLSKPSGDSVHEVFLTWKHEDSAQQKILDLLDRTAINVEMAYSFHDLPSDRFVGIFFCDFSSSKVPLEGLAEELKKLPFVVDAHSADMSGSIFEKFSFPPVIMNKHRVMIMRAEPLLRVERRLRERLGTAGTVMLYEEGKIYAKDVIRHYMEFIPNASKEALLENLKDGLRATGFGIFRFDRISEGYLVKIEHPPLLQDVASMETGFLRGIAAGVIESLFFNVIGVRDTNYIAATDTLTFKLLR